MPELTASAVRIDDSVIGVMLKSAAIKNNLSEQLKLALKGLLEKLRDREMSVVEYDAHLAKRYVEMVLLEEKTGRKLNVRWSMDGGYSFSGDVDWIVNF